MNAKIILAGDFSSLAELEGKLKQFFSKNPGFFSIEASRLQACENATEKEALSFIKKQIEACLKPNSAEQELVITLKSSEIPKNFFEIGFYFKPKKNTAETWIKTGK